MGRAALTTTLIFLAVIFGPVIQFQQEEYRLFTEPLVIAIPPNNPSLSALQDMKLEIPEGEVAGLTQFQHPSQTEPTEKLVAGEIIKKVEAKKISTFTSLKVAVASDMPNMHDVEGNLLPLRDRMALMESYLVRQTRADLSSPTWRDVAENLLATQHKEDITEAKEKLVKAKSGTTILVAKNENYTNTSGASTIAPNKKSDTESTIPSGNPGSTNGKSSEKTSDNSEDIEEKRVTKNSADSLEIRTSEIITEPIEKRPFKISGEILLGGGLAYMGGGTHLNIYREWNGHVEDIGSFSAADAKYEIEVQELSGFLIVELTNNEGQLLGFAESDLHTWEQSPLLNPHIEGVHFLIEPAKAGIVTEYFSARDLARKISEDLVKIKYKFWDRWFLFLRGLYQDAEILDGSETWVEAEAPKSLKTIVNVQTQGLSKVVSYPIAYVESLAFSLDQKLESQKGQISGELIGPDKQPLAGAKVEIWGVKDRAKVFYFETLDNKIDWPNKKIKETQANGKFLALNLEPGNYLLRVTYKNQVLPADYVWVKSDAVTHLNLDFGKERFAGIHLKDPIFNVDRLGAKIRILGSERESQVYGNDHDRISFPKGIGHLIIEADAGTEYLLSKTTISRKARNIDYNLVPQAWFNKIVFSSGKKTFKELGHVFGIVKGDDFEVQVSDENGVISDVEILYFNKSGELLDQATGVSEGGFLILNLPEAWHQVSVWPSNSNKIFVKSLLPDQEFVESLSVDFNQPQ